MSKKKFIFIFVLIVITMLIFLVYGYKKGKYGNNIFRTSEEITQKILNISSYKSIIEVTVVSNKNENKYVIEQGYKTPNIYYQKVLEPSNIKGLETTYDGTTLKIKNSTIEAEKIYNNYQSLADNHLCLHSFIDTYLEGVEAKYIENENEIIMKAKIKSNENSYIVYKTLYIDKKTNKPTKMELKDINEKTLINIKYMEIELNNEEIYAFDLKLNNKDI